MWGGGGKGALPQKTQAVESWLNTASCPAQLEENAGRCDWRSLPPYQGDSTACSDRQQGSNESFDPCLPCVIKLMTVFCVHSVLEHQQQQLDLPEARCWAALARGTICQSGRHAWTVHHMQFSTPSHMEAMNVNIPSAFRAPNLFCDTKCMTSSNFYSIFCMAESYTPISLSSLADTVDTNAVGLSAWQNSFDCIKK
jgi:hypothetical protein